jgi:hypothetical protein
LKGDKLQAIQDFIAAHPGCTSHEICRGLADISYLSLVYYSAKRGYIRAEKDERFKRANLYYPVEAMG